MHLAHLGATRAYLFRDGNLCRLTRDHTIGESPGADRRPDFPPDLIIACLGYQATVRETKQVPPVALRRGDMLLLSTGGLHRHVAAAAIEGALRASSDLAAVRDALLARAREAVEAGLNRSQEVTVLVARLVGAD
jgi:PPM family protein phosphatase